MWAVFCSRRRVVAVGPVTLAAPDPVAPDEVVRDQVAPDEEPAVDIPPADSRAPPPPSPRTPPPVPAGPPSPRVPRPVPGPFQPAAGPVHVPCPCCYYKALSVPLGDDYFPRTPGWFWDERLLDNGTQNCWTWWHGDAPHQEGRYLKKGPAEEPGEPAEAPGEPAEIPGLGEPAAEPDIQQDHHQNLMDLRQGIPQTGAAPDSLEKAQLGALEAAPAA